MAKLTINSAIELSNTLKTRLEDIKNLRDRNIADTTERWGDKETIKTCLFDPTTIDERVVNMQNAIRLLNTSIKESNVKTTIEVGIDEMQLLSAIPRK